MRILGRRTPGLPLALLGLVGLTLVLAAWIARVPAGVPVTQESRTAPGRPDSLARPAQERKPVESGFVGVVLAPESVEVATTVGGRIESVNVVLGDHVSKGSLIASLDSRQLRQDIVVAEAAIRAATAERDRAVIRLEEAVTRLGRMDALGDVVSAQDRSQAHSEQRLAQATLEEARARVDKENAQLVQLREALANTEIRAPFDGTVAARHADTGSSLAAGAAIVRLLKSGDPIVRFAVPGDVVDRLRRDQAVEFRLSSGGDGRPARIERISPEVDPASQMFVVEARLLSRVDQAMDVRPGTNGRVSLIAP